MGVEHHGCMLYGYVWMYSTVGFFSYSLCSIISYNYAYTHIDLLLLISRCCTNMEESVIFKGSCTQIVSERNHFITELICVFRIILLLLLLLLLLL